MTDHNWVGFVHSGLPRLQDASAEDGLWPSGRGTEIATLRCSEPALLNALMKILWPPSPAQLARITVEGNPILMLRDFAGQRAISFAFDEAAAPGLVSVIADLGADAGRLRADLAALLAPSITLIPSEAERVVRPGA